MSTFVTSDELRELTGYRYPKHQLGWLQREGWKYAVDALGRPKVLRAHLEEKLGGAGARQRRRTEPNFAVLDTL